MPSDECTRDLELFFTNGLYNSCEATDDLIKRIENSQDEVLAKKALFLYQEQYSKLSRPWDNVTFMYGLGLLYMHFNAYKWAIKAFREAIYVEPNFERSKDVHTRLGLIFKATRHCKLSEKHFNLAINDTRPNSGTSTRLELEFHLAHLHEIQGRLKQAKEAYERLLQEKDLPHKLSANIHRQLGWMYFNNDLDGAVNNRKQNIFNSQQQNPLTNSATNGRLDSALNYLNTSYRTDSDPRTSYYLGRCLTNIGKFQDAFASYRSVIEGEESTADTWCSIGVLYHRQNQPTDALQAYIRSVQFDKKHSVAWMNLGILYESHKQFQDALRCYQHVLWSNSDSANGIDESLQARIWFIQRQMAEIEASNNGKPKLNQDKLLSLEDLWNLESKTSSEANSNSTNIKNVPEVSKIMDTNTSTATTTKPPIIPTINNTPIQNFQSNNVSLLNNCANKIEKFEEELDNLNQVLTHGGSKDSGISSNSSTYADSALVPSQNTYISSTTNQIISAEQVIEACKNSPKPKKIDINLLSDESIPSHIFTKAPPYPPFPPDKLFPSPSSIFLETKKDLATKKLQEFCQSSPISIMRNTASVLKLDLGLFSTKTLVECNPNQDIQILSHIFQQTHENSDEHSINSSQKNINYWSCKRQITSSTIARYASYQVATFRESLQEERESKSSGSKQSNLTKESETDSNESASAQQAKRLNNNSHQQSTSHLNNDMNQTSSGLNAKGICSAPPASKRLKKEPAKPKYVRSAVEIDLSDEKIWRPQLNELNKLPNFIKCVSAANMLTHVGTSISGINATVMSMHVPGCRILGNRVGNNFCTVNINVGPGDYEWCAVSAEYGTVLNRLCKRNGFELDDTDWWPRISDLKKFNIPVYRFSQRPGDLVWVNSGTIFWIQATGWCNNIFWNVGPLNAKQFRSASELTELNKLLFRKSDVPMVQLTWNIIININIIPDEELYHFILDVLRRSLQYCNLVKELLNQSDQEIQLVNETETPGPKTATFCSLCESEVFNIHFIKKMDESTVHCVECARRSDPTFVKYKIEQQYDLKYLMKLYDNFIETRKKYQSRQQQLRSDY